MDGSVEAVWGEHAAHKAVSFSNAGIYGKFLAWLLWTDGVLGLWQKINTYLLTEFFSADDSRNAQGFINCSKRDGGQTSGRTLCCCG